MSVSPAVKQANPVNPIVVLVAWVAGIATLIIRLAVHGRSFDLFGDEVIYTDLGRSVLSGGFPRFGGPFFLHGPGYFYLEAGWARLAGHPGSLMGWIYEMRTLNGLLAGATVLHIHNPPDILAGAGAVFRLAGRKVIFDHHDLFPETVEVKFGPGVA